MQKKLAYRYKSYIAIGSNVGNWKSNFNNALNLMNKFGHVNKVSRVYFTKPFGLTTQKYFHNAAFLFLTNLFFNELFIKMSAVEKLIKKNKILENGPRRIDLDLIQFENLKVKNHLISISSPFLYFSLPFFLDSFQIFRNSSSESFDSPLDRRLYISDKTVPIA